MSIRSTANAIIVYDSKVLLVKCHHKEHGYFYVLPGGGQNTYEPFLDALIRECLEETGYTVKPVRFAALCEQIWTNPAMREQHPDSTHSMRHYFICELTGNDSTEPTEKDDMQVGVEWVPLDDLSSVVFFNKTIGDNLYDIIYGNAPLFLGTEYCDLVI